jgi:hypothetical protein
VYRKDEAGFGLSDFELGALAERATGRLRHLKALHLKAAALAL